jgi:hypothetical protein
MRCLNTPVSAQFIIVNPGRISKRRIANKSSSSGRSSSAYVFQIYALAICVTSRLSADFGADLVSLACHAVSRCGKKQDITNYVRSFVFSDRNMWRWKAKDGQLVIDTHSQKANGM